MKNLSLTAKIYIWSVLIVGGIVALRCLASLPAGPEQWLTFATLLLCAATAQLFPVVTPKNQAYYVTIVFFFAGVLLLPPAAIVLLVVLAFVPEWFKHKYPWYIQTFNMANFLMAAFIARTLYVWAGGQPGTPLGSWVDLLAAVFAAGGFTFVNHLLLAVVLKLARGHTWQESGLFEAENYLTDMTLACTGAIAALLWQTNPMMLGLVAAPLFLIHRALNTANLREQARTDSKTGLYNARHFYQTLREELHRAARFQRPLAIIIADMDLLRNINNTYGHLAGDVVLKGVADAIKAGLRDYDLAARFGGEEFAIMLPETDAQEALAVAERIRQDVEGTCFSVPTSVKPIQATLSLGVASFPTHGRDANEVIHQADLAVYYAKLRGRNLAWVCSPESRALATTVASGRLLDICPESVLKDQSQKSEAEDTSNSYAEIAVERELELTQPGLGRAGFDEAETAIGVHFGARCAEHAAGNAEAAPSSGATDQSKKEDSLTWSAKLLIAAVFATALAFWVIVQPWQANLDWLGLFALGLLTAIAQSVPVDIYRLGRISISAVIVLAGGILFGAPAALLLAAVAALVQWGLSKGIWYRCLFDLGTLTLSALTATAVYHWLVAFQASPDPILLVGPALVAAVAYYVVNVGLLTLVMALCEKSSPITVWNERFRWLTVHYVAYGAFSLFLVLGYQAIGVYGLAAYFLPPLLMRYVMKQYTERTEGNVAKLKRMNEELAKANEEGQTTLRELRATYEATLEALSTALDSRDSDTEGHSRRVVDYTSAIARRLGLSEEQFAALLNGALLHDVGKIGVPDDILRKAGPLTEAEWEVMKRHPEQGCRMLEHIGFLNDALPVVRHHHERYDGSGYPDKLKGEDIPLGARIFAVADAFDAMTSHRPYRTSCSIELAREEIARCAGTQFDPAVVEAFLQLEPRQLAHLSGCSTGFHEPISDKPRRTPWQTPEPLAAAAS